MSERKLASFEVDGMTYELAYNFNDLVDAESHTGCNLLDAMDRLSAGEGMTATQLRGMLYAMIIPYRGFPDEAPARIKAIGDLIRIDTRGEIFEAIGEAMAVAVSNEYAERFREAMRAAGEGEAPLPPAPQESAQPAA